MCKAISLSASTMSVAWLQTLSKLPRLQTLAVVLCKYTNGSLSSLLAGEGSTASLPLSLFSEHERHHHKQNDVSSSLPWQPFLFFASSRPHWACDQLNNSAKHMIALFFSEEASALSAVDFATL